MEKIDKNIVIILASGSGSRFGASLPKQYCNLGGRPLLMRTIDRFAEVIPAENILIVIDSAMEGLWKSLCEKERFASPCVTFGGNTRTESLAKALSALAHCPDDTIVMIHDGARPLVSKDLIHRMASIPEGYEGAVPAVPVTDTLRHIEANMSQCRPRSHSPSAHCENRLPTTAGTPSPTTPLWCRMSPAGK